jgi:cellobiose-specific phosphotransferase system component IIC
VLNMTIPYDVPAQGTIDYLWLFIVSWTIPSFIGSFMLSSSDGPG